jgi:DNA-binding HxlR family transcriptional regulator
MKVIDKKPPNPWDSKCPSRTVVDLLANKWVLLLFPLLDKGPQRNAELLRLVDGVSQKMLTETLRELEAHGLVARHDYQTVPPKVDYRLTKLGKSLGRAISVLDHWVVDHYYEVATAHARFRNRRRRQPINPV